MDELVQQSNCNLALCLIKMNKWEETKYNLIEGSKGTNEKVKTKSLYWLAKYYIRTFQQKKAVETIDSLK